MSGRYQHLFPISPDFGTNIKIEIMNSPVIVLLVAFVALAILIILMRLIFSIPTIVSNLKAQTKLLIKIAEKADVSSVNISQIMKDAQLRYDANKNIVDDK